MKIVAVTSCPTGIAHTYMAAEALEKVAKQRGHTLLVETQGSAGVEKLPGVEISTADVAVFAADAGVRERERFEGLPTVEVGVSRAINRPEEVIDEAERASHAAAQPEAQAARGLTLVAVTSCPTGIAHTYMAAEALEKAARERGHSLTVETQGSAGSEELPADVLQRADAVVFAADVGVSNRERFAGLPAVEVPISRAINRPGEVLEEAERAARAAPARSAAGAADTAPAATSAAAGGLGRSSKGGTVRQWLMTGVSYMLPFVTAGGILIALAFMLGGAIEVTEQNVYETFSIPALLLKIGQTAFAMIGPILAGFIAYAMADRPGIAPGIVGGLLANEIGAGFLGALIAGLLAGAVVMALKKVPFPGSLRGLLPVLFYPLIATLIIGALMVLVVGEPIAAVTAALTSWLQGLGTANAVILGVILGAMMALDMGGPVNKVAYTFAVGLISAGVVAPMAAVMAAGMTPPLGLALATTVGRRRFTQAEQEAGKAAWVMGASFITEGAIPFAAADPLRVIPALVLGSAVTGGLAMAFDTTLQAPHGGIFVFGLVQNWPLYLLAILIGTVVTAAAVLVLKSVGQNRSSASGATAPVATTSQEAARA